MLKEIGSVLISVGVVLFSFSLFEKEITKLYFETIVGSSLMVYGYKLVKG